jgi:ABC-type sugar transport system ATPase subunit
MVEIVLDRVTKRFDSFTAVDALTTTFPSGKVTCLLGPSGCGKTTLMRMISGLETPTEGRILVGNEDMAGLSPARRDIGMVFQYPVVYRTLSVAENIEEPLRHDARMDEAARRRRVAEMLDVLDMADRGDALMDELGAGERQKVAVGRAVARQARVVLFDEPTTNVEVYAKLQLIRAIKKVTSRLRQTIVYVTHDQTEAMTLSDEIALMDAGRIVQQDAPRAIYATPQTSFAGWFIGNPGMNYLPARAEGGAVVSPFLTEPIPMRPRQGALTLGVRPEWMIVGDGPAEGVVVDNVIGIGGRRLMTLRVGETTVAIKCSLKNAAPVGATVRCAAPAGRAIVFADGVRVAMEETP